MKEHIKRLLLVFFLLLIYTYVSAISNIPNELAIFEGENISMRIPFGISIKLNEPKSIEASSIDTEKIDSNVRKNYSRSEFSKRNNT